MTKKNPQLKKLKKGERCGKGWMTIEIKVGKKKSRACVRIVGTGKRPKKDPLWLDLLHLVGGIGS